MKFSQMLKKSRKGRLKSEAARGAPTFERAKPAGYRGGYYASHGNQHANALVQRESMRSGKIIDSSHPTSRANHGPKGNHATIAAPHGGKVGNPYHDKKGLFSSK